MPVTETTMLRWLIECAALIGFVIGAIVGPLTSAGREERAWESALMGAMPGGGAGAMFTPIIGFIMGATVPLYDVPGVPGLGRALTYGAMSFLLGFIAGTPSGFVGGLIGWAVYALYRRR